jgi:anti-anti-sigma factor
MTASKPNSAGHEPAVLRDGATLVRLTGVLDLTATRGLAPRLFELARAGGRLDLDLSGVSAVDRAGLALLVGCRRLSNSNGGRLRLLGAGPGVEPALRRTGLDRLAAFGSRTASHRPPVDGNSAVAATEP